ncbi:16S rRNA (guanine(966)-N(2))-methyltransferase RsmD [Desulfobacterales bacterium HSG2]|nr:16S rRNA (guanine(966)-N(2))-methyltransferase RsmD [Desulfobacterales bacterium HSG2]
MGLRIISGSLKGKKLHSVRGRVTRPTADRLRESIFNILSFRTRDAIVADLFAGTGAFGIEALSRGAAFAVFVEKYRDALSVIERNVCSCALEDRTKIIRRDIKYNLNCLRSLPCLPFNLVFMDPPYNKNLIRPALCGLHAGSFLKKGACVIVEHSPPEQIPEDCSEYAIADQRRYGKTLVSFLDYML